MGRVFRREEKNILKHITECKRRRSKRKTRGTT
jgi:hypothetical protein